MIRFTSKQLLLWPDVEHSTLVSGRLGDDDVLCEAVYVPAVESQVGPPRQVDLAEVMGVAPGGVIQPGVKAVLPSMNVTQNPKVYFGFPG